MYLFYLRCQHVPRRHTYWPNSTGTLLREFEWKNETCHIVPNELKNAEFLTAHFTVKSIIHHAKHNNI